MRRLLRVPWTARRSNQSILKEISSEYSLEGLMLKLKTLATWYLGEELTHWKRSWCWERLTAGKEGDNRGQDGRMASPTQWTRVWVNSGSWQWTGRPGVLQFMGSQRIGHNWAIELNWTVYYLNFIWSLKHSENEDHGIPSHHFMGNRWGNSGNSVRLYFSAFQNHCRWWLQPWN